jgi:N-acetylneuraminate synthase
LYDLYEEAHTPWEWHKAIIERCEANNMVCFSTPFDETAVDFLESINVPCYKIASFENTDTALIKKVVSTGKPVLISTGMATLAELDEMVRLFRNNDCNNFILLKCTSTYPASPKNSNLVTIPHMRELFGCQIGLSDHTPGIGVAIAAVTLGATAIEKHFTLQRSDGGVDSAFSLEPKEMKNLITETERAWQGLGKIKYGPTKSEEGSLFFRRSLFIVQDIESGGILSEENLKAIRPGFGLPPKYYHELIGKHTNRKLAKGTPMKWDYIG